MRRETPFPTQKRKANESHKQSIGQQPNRETVPNSEAYPKDADYLYLRPLEGARAPHCLVLEVGVGGYVTRVTYCSYLSISLRNSALSLITSGRSCPSIYIPCFDSLHWYPSLNLSQRWAVDSVI